MGPLQQLRTRRSRAAPCCRAAWALGLLIHCTALLMVAAGREAPRAAAPPQAPMDQFLLPFAINGPFNQRRDIRNYLALSRELGRRVILTGILKHYSDTGRDGGPAYEQQQAALHGGLSDAPACFKPNVHGYMPVESVLDMDVLEEAYGTVTVSGLRQATDWDGTLDALVYPPAFAANMSKYTEPIMELARVRAPNATTVLIAFEDCKLGCDPGKLQELRELIKPYKYVGMYRISLDAKVRPNLMEEQALQVPQLAGCRRELAEGNRALRPAAWLRNMADRYIDKFIGSRDFLCMHVRPYGDPCLEAWRDGRIRAGRPFTTAVCDVLHLDLHDRVGPCAANYIDVHNLSRVFVMTHPVIRHQVHDLMARAGVTGVAFVDPLHVEQTAGCIDHSATFLSMVEESICAQATHFIGSHISSISQSLGFIRLGMGRTNNAFFEASC